jgi:hypothetical protein
MNNEQQNEIFRKCRPDNADVLMINKRIKEQNDPNLSYAYRSERNTWAEDFEETLRSLAPYPISYDVGSVQGCDFSEFTYTEFPGGGIWADTQSREINCRIMENASKIDGGELGDYMFEKFLENVTDKYKLNAPLEKYYDHIIFMPGHNLLDLADKEQIQRLVQEEDDVVIKPHPLTDYDFMRMLASKLGWQKVLWRDVSGVDLLLNCKTVYSTTASEMLILGAALGKTIYNISVFSAEGAGVYQPISRILTIAQKREGKEAAIQKLKNILACPWTGIVFPFTENPEENMKKFFDKALEMREMYRPLSSGRGKLDSEARPHPEKPVRK